MQSAPGKANGNKALRGADDQFSRRAMDTQRFAGRPDRLPAHRLAMPGSRFMLFFFILLFDSIRFSASISSANKRTGGRRQQRKCVSLRVKNSRVIISFAQLCPAETAPAQTQRYRR